MSFHSMSNNEMFSLSLYHFSEKMIDTKRYKEKERERERERETQRENQIARALPKEGNARKNERNERRTQ